MDSPWPNFEKARQLKPFSTWPDLLNSWNPDALLASVSIVNHLIRKRRLKQSHRLKYVRHFASFALNHHFPARGDGCLLVSGYVLPSWTLARWAGAALKQPMPLAHYFTLKENRDLFEICLQPLAKAWRDFEDRHGQAPDQEDARQMVRNIYRDLANYDWDPTDPNAAGSIVFQRMIHSGARTWLSSGLI